MMEKDGKRLAMFPFSLPVLLPGYLETLRMAVFYAFGWDWSWLLLCISLLISINMCGQFYKPSKILNFLTLTMVSVLITLTGLGIEKLGDFGRLLSTAGVVLYAVMVFLIYTLILERKSAKEVFILGALLSLIAAVVSDQGILVYLVMNIIFAFGLHSQLHFFSLQTNSRVRGVGNSGLNGRFWNGVSFVVIMVSVLIAVLMPTLKGTTGGLAFLRQETSGVNAAGRSYADSDFWGRMQNFDFNGDVPVDETPVLLVRADHPSYWRGEAADYYTGSGWQNSMVLRAVNKADYINPYQGTFPVSRMEQVFTLLPGCDSEVIYFAGSPTMVNISESNLATDDGGNFYNRSFSTGMTYKVVSYIGDFSSDRLKKAAGEYPPEILEKYLQLPRIPDRVRELAKRLTVTALTPYEKAKKIEVYLTSHYPYETTVIPPTGKQDVVDYFLFDLKKGYCTYHSSAMAVMLRSIGIPSRWVTGFTTGSFSKQRDAYIVSMKDAHAWVEAYIPGAGWVPFEPTSSFVIPSSAKLTNDSLKAVTAQSEKSYLDTASFRTSLPIREFNVFARSAGTRLLVILIVITAALLVFLGRKMMRAKNNDNKFDPVEQIYHVFLKLIAQKGYYKSAGQTPLEFAGYLCTQDTFFGCSNQIIYVTNAYLRHRFSLEKLNSAEVNELKSVLKDLSKLLGFKSWD